MKINYEGIHGKLGLEAYMNNTTPVYILNINDNTEQLQETSVINLLNGCFKGLKTNIAESKDIIKCSNAYACAKVKKNELVILVQTVNDKNPKADNKNGAKYLKCLFDFIQESYNNFSEEQKKTPEARKLQYLLNEVIF
jgi:hypothetical protein